MLEKLNAPFLLGDPFTGWFPGPLIVDQRAARGLRHERPSALNALQGFSEVRPEKFRKCLHQFYLAHAVVCGRHDAAMLHKYPVQVYNRLA